MNLFKKVFVTLQAQGRHPLNRDSSLRAAWKFVIAQLASRAAPGEICVEFPNESRLLIPPHMKGAAHFIHPGLCEFEDMAFVLHFIRPEDLFVDIGANVGAYTVLAAAAVGARAIAFEPNPSTFHALAANVSLNRLDQRVIAINAALGQNEGTLKMTDGLGTENRACLDDKSSGGVAVLMTTLDKHLDGQSPVLLKIDVEGFESAVFAGAGRTLANPSLQAMIIEKNGAGQPYGFDEDALHSKIRDHGFIPCSYDPFKRTLTVIAADVGGNILYVRDLSHSQKRLQSALAFRFRDFKI